MIQSEREKVQEVKFTLVCRYRYEQRNFLIEKMLTRKLINLRSCRSSNVRIDE